MLKHTIASDDFREKNIAQKGFTLIELLVVILILGILAAVVVIAVSNLTDNAQKNSCKTERRQILTAVEAYRAQYDDADAEPTFAQIEAEDLLDQEVDVTRWTSNTGPIYTAGRASLVGEGDCVDVDA